MVDAEKGESTPDTSESGGTYSLLLDLAEPTEIEVGALGELSFDAGSYVYTGSAFGPGGFARVDRHREIASGGREVRHWHIDYLLGHNATTIEAVWVSRGADRECEIATELPGDPVQEFGASDCDCEAHLGVAPSDGGSSRNRLVDALDTLHDVPPDR